MSAGTCLAVTMGDLTAYLQRRCLVVTTDAFLIPLLEASSSLYAKSRERQGDSAPSSPASTLSR